MNGSIHVLFIGGLGIYTHSANKQNEWTKVTCCTNSNTLFVYVRSYICIILKKFLQNLVVNLRTRLISHYVIKTSLNQVRK
jgi:hypothetical protein